VTKLFLVMVQTGLTRVMALVALVALSACAAQRPVLSPNDHLNRVGSAVAERDVDECMRRAEGSVFAAEGGGNTGEKAAADAVTGVAVGAAAGGAGGAVAGNAGQGAAIGAASAAAASTMYALLRTLFTSQQPRPGYRETVNACLRQKGYDLTGWK
jgi:hypothetical protein